MITIRQLKKDDAAEVAKLIPQLTSNIIEPENLVERLKDLATGQNWQYFVVELDEKISGFGGLTWYNVPSKGKIGWIEEIVIDEKSRGQGLGRKLLEKLIAAAQARGCAVIKLTTANPLAKKLYENLGFIDKEQTYLAKKLI